MTRLGSTSTFDSTKIDVLGDSLFVMEQAKHVFVCPDAIEAFATSQTKSSLAVPAWEKRYHFVGNDEDTVAYLLVLAAMNFGACQPEAWRFEYRGETLAGYFAVSSALKVAMENGQRLGCTKFLQQMSEPKLRAIFLGTGELPFFARRIEMLRELGSVLEAKFGGKAMGLIDAAGQSAERLLSLVANELPSFSDTAIYQNRNVALYKRAQIFIGDLYGSFGGEGCGRFADIQKITAFADDSLPFILRKLGFLRYAESLAQKVDGRVEVGSGTSEEIEIRAGSIVAVERVRRALADRGIIRNSVQLDWIFWNLSYEGSAGERHLTYSTAY